MLFSRYMLAFAPVLVYNVTAAPRYVDAEAEITTKLVRAFLLLFMSINAMPLQDWTFHFMPEFEASNYVCPTWYDSERGWVRPVELLAHTRNVVSAVMLGADDLLEDRYVSEWRGEDYIKWDNPECRGKEALFKYDVPVRPDGAGPRSPYRVVFHIRHHNRDEMEAVINFCGV
ncbi:hypothetical protein FRC06_011050, partial [Ceratobasidium sp. 370]